MDPPGRAPARARITTRSSHLNVRKSAGDSTPLAPPGASELRPSKAVQMAREVLPSVSPVGGPIQLNARQHRNLALGVGRQITSWTCARPGSAPLAGSRMEYPLRKGRSPRAGNCRCERPRGLAASDPHSCRAASGLVEVKLRCRRPKQGRVHTVRVAAIDEVLQDGVDFDRRTAL